LQTFFPHASCEDRDRDDDDGTDSTEWAKYSDDEFLINNIRVKHDTTDRHDGEDFCWTELLREPSPECYDEQDRIDDHSDHRKCDFEITDRENNRTWVLENS